MTAEELAGSSLPAAEKKSFRRYSVPTTLRAPSGGYKHSFVHKAPVLITSDLMITEEYHYNKDHLNLSIIELHNPTLDPIYLRHYGLMKAGRDLNAGPNSVAFFPMNSSRTPTNRSVSTDDRSDGIYREAKMEHAIIMPLELRDNDYSWSYWRWRTFVPMRSNADPNMTEFYSHKPQHKVIRTGASRGDDVISTTYAAPGEEPRLDPGKTMLILGPGYIEYTPDEDGYGILYPTKPGNTGGAGQQGQLGPGVQPIQSYIKGYCQYVFAMANYSATKSNSRNDAAATNHLAEDHGIVLVKQMLDPSSPLNNGTIRKVVDTAIPYNNAGSSLSQFQSKFPFGSANTHARVRVDGDYFPSTTFDIDNWYIANISWSNEVRTRWASREYYTERMTLGSRKFVQDGSKANQNNWGSNYIAPTKQW